MATAEIIEGLCEFDGRGAGTDAERRAAGWLASQLRSAGQGSRVGGGRVSLETFWCRPNWALAASWHVVLGIAGSLVSVSSPRVGGALVVAAIVCVVADALFGVSPGRRLTPERASQNVVWSQPERTTEPASVTLILTANIDAGRTGLVHRSAVRRLTAWLRALVGGATPGWAGWLVIAMAVVEATAIARVGGARGSGVGAVQLVPTVALVLGAALLLDQATAAWGPGAGDNASGVAAAVQLARALALAPPVNARLRLVLQGAGDGGAIGLRHHLRRHRLELTSPRTVVLGLAACGDGSPRYWLSDGPLVPVRCFAPLRRRAAALLAQPDAGVRSRGTSPALPALLRRVPTLVLGARDPAGIAPVSHTSADTADRIDGRSVDAVVALTLTLVDEIDLILAERPAAGSSAAAVRPA